MNDRDIEKIAECLMRKIEQSVLNVRVATMPEISHHEAQKIANITVMEIQRKLYGHP